MNRLVPLLVASMLAAVGCAGEAPSDAEGMAPVPTSASTSAPETEPTVAATTAPETTTSTDAPHDSTASSNSVAPTDERYLPEGLGVVVDSAPGIDSPGEITELIDNVWFFVPSEPADGDANVVPPLPEDREILAAYAEAQAAYHAQASTSPLPPVPTDRVAAALLDGGQRLADVIFRPKAEAGQYLDLSAGIVLRPVVIADPRSDTEAFVFDCQLDGTVFVEADGSITDGQVPGVREFPQIASLVFQDGRWIVDRLTRDDRACA